MMTYACKRRYGVVIILFLMFTAPGLLALYFYLHPQMLGSETINKGRLIQGAVKIPVLKDKTKWALVYWAPKGCRKDCLQQLDKLARVRLALGRRYYDLDEWLLMDKNTDSLSPELAALLQDQNISQKRINTDAGSLHQLLSSKPEVFIVSPNHYFVLSYATNAPPDDIYKDIKHLLNSSESRSGPRNAR